MFKYIIKRIGSSIFVLFIVSILLFSIYKMVPGDPARMMLDNNMRGTDPAKYEMMYNAARERLGLDKPLVVQYFSWIGNTLTGDFGYSSMYRQDVVDVVAEPMRNSIILNLASLVLVFAITIPLGIATAVRKYSTFDNIVQISTVVGYSLPSFIIALAAIFLFAIKMPLFPISGMLTAGAETTGLARAMDMGYHMVLPLLVMVLSSLGGITRYVRGEMIEVLRMDYIRTARSKGLREKVVIYIHAFRNAMIPLVTIIISWFVGVFGGSIVIEATFMWNGIGKVLFESLKQHDFAVVLTMQIFYVVLTLVANLLMDLAYGLVDPRVKLE